MWGKYNKWPLHSQMIKSQIQVRKGKITNSLVKMVKKKMYKFRFFSIFTLYPVSIFLEQFPNYILNPTFKGKKKKPPESWQRNHLNHICVRPPHQMILSIVA